MLRQKLGETPHIIDQARFHRGRDPQRLVDANEVVPRHEDGDGGLKALPEEGTKGVVSVYPLSICGRDRTQASDGSRYLNG